MKDMKNAIDHMRTHQTYPATSEELIQTCNELGDFSADDKKWFADHLPKGTYNSAEEVMKALGVDEKNMKMMDKDAEGRFMQS
jgi:hypothetical protein